MTTCRRYYLDKLLFDFNFYGKVLDIGGKKTNKRGKFRPPIETVESWRYLNTEKSTRPDFLCSSTSVCIRDNLFDIVILTEVLEHIDNPTDAIRESRRILKHSGKILISMPFLYPVHADPNDFQRWTKDKLTMELTANGFIIDNIQTMGGFFSVIYDLFLNALKKSSKNQRAIKNRILLKLFFPYLFKIVIRLDKIYDYKANWITTGYFVIGTKAE